MRIFEDEVLLVKLKSIGEHKNMVRFFYLRLRFFVKEFHNNECKTVFSTTVLFWSQSMNKNEKRLSGTVTYSCGTIVILLVSTLQMWLAFPRNG